MESMTTAQPVTTPPDPMDKFSPSSELGGTTTPQIQTSPTITPPPPSSPTIEPTYAAPKGRSKTPLIILVGLLVVLLLLIGSGAFLALVAYGKVDINNEELQRKISFAVQDLPYTPKTAEYLIYKGFDANKDTQSFYLDASVAVTAGESVAQIPGLGNKFDLTIEGPIDYHDKENPEVEINVKLTPELDADLVVVNEKLFFKLNSIPVVLKGYLDGAGYSLDIIMNKWISYSLAELESEARSTLEEDKGVRDEERLERVKMAILNSNIIDKVVVEETELDGNAVYKMTLALTSEEYMNFLNDVARAVEPESYADNFVAETDQAETFEDLEIETYIEKSSMRTVRSMISFRVNADRNTIPTQVLGASTIQYFPNIYTQAVSPESNYVDVVAVINTTRFNEDFQIAEPQGATPLETIVEQYTQQIMMREGLTDDASGFGDDASGFSTDSPLEEEEDSGISPY